MTKKTSNSGVIDEFKFLMKLTDIYMFVYRLNNKGLAIDTVMEITTDMSSQTLELLSDPSIYVNNTPPSTQALGDMSNKIFSQNYYKISNYKNWTMNHGLIMLCSLFEEYLIDLLKAVLKANPHLTSWSSENEIISQFSMQSIKDKVNTLKNRLNVEEKELFDFKIFTLEIQKKFENVGFEDLIKIYKKRDTAAHTDRFVIKNIEELEYIRELFEKLILNSSLIFRKKWNIQSGLVNYYKKNS